MPVNPINEVMSAQILKIFNNITNLDDFVDDIVPGRLADDFLRSEYHLATLRRQSIRHTLRDWKHNSSD